MSDRLLWAAVIVGGLVLAALAVAYVVRYGLPPSVLVSAATVPRALAR